MTIQDCSRRDFLKLSAAAGMLGALGSYRPAQGMTVSDYKALVCIFMFGGNDGHNTVIPMSASEFAAYQQKRPGLALPNNHVLPITTTTGGQYGFNYGMPELQQLFGQGKVAVLANVG